MSRLTTTLAAVSVATSLLGAATEAVAKDQQIKEVVQITDDIQFGIRGKNRDGIAVIVKGRVVFGEWLWNDADRPGTLKPEEVHSTTGPGGTTISFSWGANDDLVYAIRVIGDDVITTEGEYWRHPSGKRISISFADGGHIVRYGPPGGVKKYLQLKRDRWVRR